MGSMLLVIGVRKWLSSYKQDPKISSLHLFFIFKLSLKLVLAKAECLLEPGLHSPAEPGHAHRLDPRNIMRGDS